jgi:sulfur relay (sulfurtransferase) DsrC/TusE family protein
MYPVNDRFGIAGGLSWQDREFSTDNVEADGWDVTDGGIAYADTIEYRDYDVVRERTSGSLSVDFQATDSTVLYARAMYSLFEDTESRRALIMEMDEEPSDGDASARASPRQMAKSPSSGSRRIATRPRRSSTFSFRR